MYMQVLSSSIVGIHQTPFRPHFKVGFDPSYKTWIHYGELDLLPPLPVIDNTRQRQMSDMTALHNDLSYIPPNNEQNEPTQGDIGETSNDPTQAKCNEFEELYFRANEKLYPSYDYVTRLDFMAKFTYFKVKEYEADDEDDEVSNNGDDPGVIYVDDDEAMVDHRKEKNINPQWSHCYYINNSFNWVVVMGVLEVGVVVMVGEEDKEYYCHLRGERIVNYA
nr:hypothetical protein [Tanacetum cinerariifolium]